MSFHRNRSEKVKTFLIIKVFMKIYINHNENIKNSFATQQNEDQF